MTGVRLVPRPLHERNPAHSSAVFADTAITTRNAGALVRRCRLMAAEDGTVTAYER